MPQIWWCIQIFHLLISFFNHFSKWSVGVSIHVWVVISMRFDTARLMVRPASAVWHPFLEITPGCEVYAVFSCTHFATHCAAHIHVDVWCGILFLTCFHDSCLMWCRIIYGMYLLSWFVMFCSRSLCHHVDGILMCCHACFHWDPFYSMLAVWSLSSCMSLCHTDRSPFD